MLQYLVILGAFAQLIGISFYIKSVVKGNVKPNRLTWFLWSIAPIIATFAAISKGVSWAVLPTFMAGFGPFLVFLASFVNKKSYWKLGKVDYLCGVFSILALILWYITKEANVAIVFTILSDLTAGLPTLIKAWREPESETAAPFITGLFSTLTTFFAITMWQFAELAFPIYLILFNIVIICTIKRDAFTKVSKRTSNANR
jgi:hypothetical protein